METTASNPATSGRTPKTAVAIRIGATTLIIAAGLGLAGIAAAGTVAADEPTPTVHVGARPMQFR